MPDEEIDKLIRLSTRTIIQDILFKHLEEFQDSFGTYKENLRKNQIPLSQKFRSWINLTLGFFRTYSKASGLNGYMSQIDKCNFVKINATSRVIIRKGQLYLRDFNRITESVELNIVMFPRLKNLLELVVTIDAKGYVSIIFNLDAWENYMTGKFTGKNAAENGWKNLINHIPTNSIMISIDKYPKTANSELEPHEIKRRIKAKDFFCESELLI